MRAYVRALEKADTPSDPVEQTTRIAAPAPPPHWPLRRASERDGRTRRSECERVRKTAVDGCEGFRSLTPFKATVKSLFVVCHRNSCNTELK